MTKQHILFIQEALDEAHDAYERLVDLAQRPVALNMNNELAELDRLARRLKAKAQAGLRGVEAQLLKEVHREAQR